MSEYEIGKEVGELARKVETMESLMEQVYAVVEHNLKNKILKELPVEKK